MAAPTAPSVTPGPTPPKQKAAPTSAKRKRRTATATDDDLDLTAKQSKQMKEESDHEEVPGDDSDGVNHGDVYYETRDGDATDGDAAGNADKAEGTGKDSGGIYDVDRSDPTDEDDDGNHQNSICD